MNFHVAAEVSLLMTFMNGLSHRDCSTLVAAVTKEKLRSVVVICQTPQEKQGHCGLKQKAKTSQQEGGGVPTTRAAAAAATAA